MPDTDMTISTPDSDEQPARMYIIDPEAAERNGRSLLVLTRGRLCWVCLQGLDESEAAALDHRDFIDRIRTHCSEQVDYLLPDTPLKEAIFRALLARNGGPMNADSISKLLSERWEMSQFPRDTSREVICRLLKNSEEYYCIAPVDG